MVQNGCPAVALTGEGAPKGGGGASLSVVSHKTDSQLHPNGTYLRYRTPHPGDAAPVWRLIRDGGRLDLNSAYSYMLLFRYFADTCVIAERDGQIVGFVTGFIPPVNENVLFVWQIGVSSEARGQGIGKELLRQLLALPAVRRAKALQATVSADNEPSRRLFDSLARERGSRVEQMGEGFPPELFPEAGHEGEPMIRIVL